MNNFNKIYCRKTSSDAAFEKKSIAIALSKEGKTYREIAKIVGLSISTISVAIKAYHKKGGIKNLKRKKRGRPTDSCKTLNKKQEKHLILRQLNNRKIIKTSHPSDLPSAGQLPSS